MRGAMRSVGVGGGESLAAATLRIDSFEGCSFEALAAALERKTGDL